MNGSKASEPSQIIHLTSLDLDTLVNMVEAYRQRTYDEDVKYLENDLKGVEGLEESLKTTVEKGLTGHDFEERDSVFGSN